MHWLTDHWEFLATIIPVVIHIINSATKEWRERKTPWGRFLGLVLEALNVVEVRLRKPDIKRYHLEPAPPSTPPETPQ